MTTSHSDVNRLLLPSHVVLEFCRIGNDHRRDGDPGLDLSALSVGPRAGRRRASSAAGDIARPWTIYCDPSESAVGHHPATRVEWNVCPAAATDWCQRAPR